MLNSLVYFDFVEIWTSLSIIDTISFHNIHSQCTAKKYGDKVLQKYWTNIRQSVNQKGNDLRKKQKSQKLEGKPAVEPVNKTDGANED